MGIFDEELKKMAGEAAQIAASADQRKDELDQVARNVSKDLVSYITSSLGAGAFDVGVFENRITLRGRRTFEITCESADGFRVKETTGVQTGVREPTPYSDKDVISQSEMARWVIARVKELRGA